MVELIMKIEKRGEFTERGQMVRREEAYLWVTRRMSKIKLFCIKALGNAVTVYFLINISYPSPNLYFNP